MNNYFAGIATDNGYIKSDVLNFRRIDGNQDCGVWNFSDYEVQLYLPKIRNTSSGIIMIYHVGFSNNVLMNYPVLLPLFLTNPFRQVPYLSTG